MTTFIYIPGWLEQVWACISWLHLYCNYLEMIKGTIWILIGQHFPGFDIIKKFNNVISGTPPWCQNDFIKDKYDLMSLPLIIESVDN